MLLLLCVCRPGCGCSVHLIVEITIFLTLFLMLCDTYLFQVGLLGVLFAHFKAAFLLQPVYLLFTLFLDGYRIVRAAAADTVMAGAAAPKVQSCCCCSAYLWLLACLCVCALMVLAGWLVAQSFLMDRTHRLWDLYPLAGFQAMSILHKLGRPEGGRGQQELAAGRQHPHLPADNGTMGCLRCPACVCRWQWRRCTMW